MTYKLENNIPAPKAHHACKYPLGTMEVGDSFVAPESEASKLRNASHTYGKKKGRKYVTRTTDEGVRVWRVA